MILSFKKAVFHALCGAHLLLLWWKVFKKSISEWGVSGCPNRKQSLLLALLYLRFLELFQSCFKWMSGVDLQSSSKMQTLHVEIFIFENSHFCVRWAHEDIDLRFACIITSSDSDLSPSIILEKASSTICLMLFIICIVQCRCPAGCTRLDNCIVACSKFSCSCILVRSYNK